MSNTSAVEKFVPVLAPLGWALHKSWPSDHLKEVARLIDRGASSIVLDDAVTAMWNEPDPRRIGFAFMPLGRFGRTVSTEFQRRAQLRAELASQALASHIAGQFAAAMTLTLSQIDGLTSDVMGSTFFQHAPDPSAPGYADDATFVGTNGNLAEVRRAFSKPQDVTGRHTSISRHAIMHGRDLTFGTRSNSTKALVLLGALTEFLEQPASTRAKKERRRSDDQLRKLTGYDGDGRLRDSRCLDEVGLFRGAIETDLFATMRMSGLDEKNVTVTATRRLTERRLHRDSFNLLAVEGHRFAWSFRLPAGHFLGAAVEITDANIPVQMNQLTWDRVEPPAGPPWTNPAGWSETMNGTPQTPNWRMRPFFT